MQLQFNLHYNFGVTMSTAVSIPENLGKRTVGTWQGLKKYIADLEEFGLTFASARLEVYDKDGTLTETFSHLECGMAERRAASLNGKLYAVLSPEAIQS